MKLPDAISFAAITQASMASAHAQLDHGRAVGQWTPALNRLRGRASARPRPSK